MRSHFLRTAASCFLFLVIIDYVKALPVHSRNNFAHDHEYKEGLKKYLYGRSGGGYSSMEATSSAMHGPEGGDQQTSEPKAKRQRTEPPTFTGEEGAQSDGAHWLSKQPSSTTSLPTHSNVVPEDKELEGLTKSPSGQSKDGDLKANSLAMRVSVGGSKRIKLPSERRQPHTVHAEVGQDGKTMSHGRPSDDAAHKQTRISKLRQYSSELKDVGKMIDALIKVRMAQNDGDQEEAVPWKNGDRWPVGLVRAVIVQIFCRTQSFFSKRRVRNEDRPKDLQLDLIVQINKMERSQLNEQMDNLWLWAIQRRADTTHNASNNAQARARKGFEENRFDDEKDVPGGDRLASLLLQSLSKSTYRMEEMPWRHSRELENVKTSRWTDSETKMVLKYIWNKMSSRPKSTPKLKRPSLAEQKKILASKSNLEFKQLQGKMDEAWEWWVTFREQENGYHHKGRVTEAGRVWQQMEKECIKKYAEFEY